MKMRCPHCNSWAFTRSSSQITNTTRESYLACKNFECGHTFSVVSTINRTISPSATPDPTVVLPLSTHIQRHLLQQQLQSMPGADYRPTQAETRAMNRDLFEPDPRTG